MRRHPLPWILALGALLAVAGCATSFSPAKVRAEVARQTGAEPARAFELQLGRATLALTRQLVGPGHDGELPLAGLDRLELAVYTLPAGSGPVDFTAMPVYGWDPAVRAATAKGSTVVLVRGSGDRLADVVLMAASSGSAIYARLRGTLSRHLPEALGAAVSSGGVAGVQHQLGALGGGAAEQ